VRNTVPKKAEGSGRVVARAARVGVAFLAMIASAVGQEEGGSKRKPIVLVPPFENQSKYHVNINYEVAGSSKANQSKRRFVVDRYTEAPRSIFEDMLGNTQGVTVVERQRVDALLVESEFGRLSGLVDTEKAVKLGKLLGANLIVLGTIIDIRDEKRDFKGYGIESKMTDVICQMRVRLLEIESGSIKFSKVIKGTKNYAESNYGGTSSSDRNFAAVEVALQKLGEDPQFRRALVGGKPGADPATDADGLLEVEFAPKPPNSDIEIDGKYVGGSPLKRRLKAGKEIKVRISKGGYQPWEHVIVPEPGLRINPDLGTAR